MLQLQKAAGFVSSVGNSKKWGFRKLCSCLHVDSVIASTVCDLAMCVQRAEGITEEGASVWRNRASCIEPDAAGCLFGSTCSALLSNCIQSHSPVRLTLPKYCFCIIGHSDRVLIPSLFRWGHLFHNLQTEWCVIVSKGNSVQKGSVCSLGPRRIISPVSCVQN